MGTESLMPLAHSKIVEYVERIILAVTALLQQAGQPVEYGGHLVIREGKFGSTVLLAKLGYLEEDGCNDIADHSEAMHQRIKAAQNAAYPVWNCSRSVSYCPGRQPKFAQRAGAVGGHSLIFSFYSKHDQFLDEAAMFVLAIRLGQLRESDVCEVIGEERNPHLRPLLEACHWTE